MLVQLAIIGLLCIVLWLVTKRRESLFRARRLRRPRSPAWFNKRLAEWKGALNVLTSSTSKEDAVAKLKAARNAKHKPSLARRVYTAALRKARNKKYVQVPQIVESFTKTINNLQNSKTTWITNWLRSKKTQQLIYNDQVADAKKYGNANDFVAAYQKKVSDLMAKKTTSTFQGEEDVPDDMRIQLYQKAIGDMQKAGNINAFIKTRQAAVAKAKAAAKAKKRRAKAGVVAKQASGNYYFYFNSIK